MSYMLFKREIIIWRRDNIILCLLWGGFEVNIEDLRKISFEFRRVSSDMLNSITDDNNVYLIKFREFIDDNKIIKDYIDSKVKYSSIDWKK